MRLVQSRPIQKFDLFGLKIEAFSQQCFDLSCFQHLSSRSLHFNNAAVLICGLLRSVLHQKACVVFSTHVLKTTDTALGIL